MVRGLHLTVPGSLPGGGASPALGRLLTPVASRDFSTLVFGPFLVPVLGQLLPPLWYDWSPRSHGWCCAHFMDGECAGGLTPAQRLRARKPQRLPLRPTEPGSWRALERGSVFLPGELSARRRLTRREQEASPARPAGLPGSAAP